MARLRRFTRIKRLWFTKRQATSGYTLIELLISMLIGAIIVVALLSLVVELTDTDQKDAARTATQQEMQAAMDYVVRDLREAVYVYDGKCLSEGTAPTFKITDSDDFPKSCPKLLDHLPSDLSTNGRVPVLAFWRANPLPDAKVTECANAYKSVNSGDPDPVGVQDVACLSGRTYSLVVYSIVDNSVNNPSGIWKGRARLDRYALTQYNASGALTSGYVPPLQSPNAKFFQWPYDKSDKKAAPVNLQTSRPTGEPQVLVDYLDSTGATPECPNPDPVNITDANLVKKVNVMTPTDAAAKNIRSFYACVRGETIDAQNLPTGAPTPAKEAEKKILTAEQAVNQEVLLVLQGNVSGRPGFPKRSTAAEEANIGPITRLAPLQTRVLVRGAVRKDPS